MSLGSRFVSSGLALLLAVAVSCAAHAQEQATPEYSPPRIEEGLGNSQRQALEALAAAYRHAGSVGYDTDGKAVLVFRRAPFLVVRFSAQQARVMDGGAEFTYDPRNGKIIRADIDG